MILCCHQGFSQKQYEVFRDLLEGLTCADSIAAYNAQVNIPLLQQHIRQHPDHYDAHYDLAMEYIDLGTDDSLKMQSPYWQKAIVTFQAFINKAPRKRKYQGYQNLAVIYFYLKQCDKAIEIPRQNIGAYAQKTKRALGPNSRRIYEGAMP